LTACGFGGDLIQVITQKVAQTPTTASSGVASNGSVDDGDLVVRLSDKDCAIVECRRAPSKHNPTHFASLAALRLVLRDHTQVEGIESRKKLAEVRDALGLGPLQLNLDDTARQKLERRRALPPLQRHEKPKALGGTPTTQVTLYMMFVFDDASSEYVGVKIGRSANAMHRASELDSETPRKYKKPWSHEVVVVYAECGCIESLVHQALRDFQLEGMKEYFAIPQDQAPLLLAKAVEKAIPEYLEAISKGERRGRESLEDEEHDAKRRRILADARAYEERVEIETRLRERQALADAEKHASQAKADAEKHASLAKADAEKHASLADIVVMRERLLAEAAVERARLENAALAEGLSKSRVEVLRLQASRYTDALDAYLTRRHTLLTSPAQGIYRLRFASVDAARQAQRRILHFVRRRRQIFGNDFRLAFRYEETECR
jgi:hypothetical protein